MRYGHRKASIIGKTWAFSLHVAVASIDLDRLLFNKIEIFRAGIALLQDENNGRLKSKKKQFKVMIQSLMRW